MAVNTDFRSLVITGLQITGDRYWISFETFGVVRQKSWFHQQNINPAELKPGTRCLVKGRRGNADTFLIINDGIERLILDTWPIEPIDLADTEIPPRRHRNPNFSALSMIIDLPDTEFDYMRTRRR